MLHIGCPRIVSNEVPRDGAPCNQKKDIDCCQKSQKIEPA